jgi:hypothetical protein
MPQKATKSHKTPQKATKSHKTPQNAHNFFVARKFWEKKKFFCEVIWS